MGWADKIMLANANVVSHFMFNIPPDPYYDRKTSVIMAGKLHRYLTREYPGKQELTCIADLLSRRNIAKNKLVETGMARNVRIDGSEGEKDSP
jgi:hypothetical protein